MWRIEVVVSFFGFLDKVAMQESRGAWWKQPVRREGCGW
jgi:hypothetical protein